MSDPSIVPIATQDDTVQAALIALNNANSRETSFLTAERWRMLVERAFAATCVGDAAAFLIAFDQDADYDGHDFLWFRQQLASFVYVDRIVVAGEQRRKGLANLLYRDLFDRAARAGQQQVVCEVNLIPPNPTSDAFHANMGFTEIGRGTRPDGSKTVRYLMKPLAAATL
jgi:predicted GNAT superfamily acetyltransferase